MKPASFNLDAEHFPQIAMRFSKERIHYLLVRMCQGMKMDVSEANLYYMASNVERDLHRLFVEKIA